MAKASPQVLVVEDDALTANAIIMKLRQKGIIADTAVDGDDAIAKVQGRAWAVILLDALLPKKDGFAVLEEIRRQPHLARTKVFMFSNLSPAENARRAHDLGADAFIEKTGVKISDIVEKIAAALAGAPASDAERSEKPHDAL